MGVKRNLLNNITTYSGKKTFTDGIKSVAEAEFTDVQIDGDFTCHDITVEENSKILVKRLCRIECLCDSGGGSTILEHGEIRSERFWQRSIDGVNYYKTMSFEDLPALLEQMREISAAGVVAPNAVLTA